MIFGRLLWTPRICVDNSLLLPLATAGTRLPRSVLRTRRCWRQSWSRRTEGTGDSTGDSTGDGGRRVLETVLETELDVRHGSF